MNKRLMMVGLAALMMNSVHATCGAAASCDKTTAAPSNDEAAFVAKLGATQSKAFNLMTAEQKLEVLAASRQGTAPDAAVDAALVKHRLALVDGALKAKTSDVK